MSESDKPGAVPLDYEAVPPRHSWVRRFNGWWVVLALLPVFIIWLHPIGAPYAGYAGYEWEARRFAIMWTSLAIGLRAVVGIIRRERTWAWIIYPPLYCFLPSLTQVITNYADEYGW